MQALGSTLQAADQTWGEEEQWEKKRKRKRKGMSGERGGGKRPTIKNSNRKQSRGSEDRTSPNGNYLGWF